MHRLGIILRVISSTYKININNFQTYCQNTAEEIVSVYPWYQIPPSLHIILIHGASIIQNTLLPIGKLAEEAIETTHKVIRRFRRHHARTTSRVQNNEDVFKRLLINSDPKISKIRCKFVPKTKSYKISEEMKNLIILNDNNLSDIDSEYDTPKDNQPLEISEESDQESDSDSDIENLLF